MPTFDFPLDSLLRLRLHERDAQRALLADVLRQGDRLRAQAEQVAARRREQSAALKQMGASGPLDVAQSIACRAFAARLLAELNELERQQALIVRQQEAVHQVLMTAEQALKSLEKLREKRRAESVAAADRLESKALEEAALAMALRDG